MIGFRGASHNCNIYRQNASNLVYYFCTIYKCICLINLSSQEYSIYYEAFKGQIPSPKTGTQQRRKKQRNCSVED